MVWHDDSAGIGPWCQVWRAEFSSWASYGGRREWRPLTVLQPPWPAEAHAHECTTTQPDQHTEAWGSESVYHTLTWESITTPPSLLTSTRSLTCITSWHIKKKIEPSVLFVSENPSMSLVKNSQECFLKAHVLLAVGSLRAARPSWATLPGRSILQGHVQHTVSCSFHLINQEEWFVIMQPSLTLST